MASKGQIIICAECRREGKLCARGLCNTCYDKWVKSRPLINCAKCGKPTANYGNGLCHRCHSAHRYQLEHDDFLRWQREARIKNPDKFRTSDKKRYQERKASGYEKKRSHLYYERHPDKVAERRKEFHRKNPDKASLYTRSYEAKKLGLPHTLTDEEWKEKVREANGLCYYCHKLTKKFHKEHRIPVSKGGDFTKENIVPSCQRCNNRKCDRTEEEFREYLKQFP